MQFDKDYREFGSDLNRCGCVSKGIADKKQSRKTQHCRVSVLVPYIGEIEKKYWRNRVQTHVGQKNIASWAMEPFRSVSD